MLQDKEKNPQSDKIASLQAKIRTQAKRLCSQQEYISVLEHRISLLNPSEKFPVGKSGNINNSLTSENELFSLYTNLQKENQRINEEKQKLLHSIQKEVIANDEQRNYIEILKQAIESSLLKNGLKPKLDTIKQKYYSSLPKDEYATVILDLSKIKENCMSLEKSNRCLNKELEISKKEIGEMNSIINKNQKEAVYLKQQLRVLEGKDEELKFKTQKLTEREDQVSKLSEKNQQCVEEIKFLKNKYSRVEEIEKENVDVNKSLANLTVEYDKLLNELNRLSLIERDALILTKENNDIKGMNQNLIKENNYLSNENNTVKQNLNFYENCQEDNRRLNEEICNLRESLNQLQTEKNKNENIYLNKIQALTQERNALQNLLCKSENMGGITAEEIKTENVLYRSDNKKLYDKNKQLNFTNIRYSTENKFYSNILYRVMKYHINNINIKNIISEMLEINERIVTLELESIKLEKEKNKKNDENISYEYSCNQQQISELSHKLACLDQELQNYEIH